MAPAIQLLWRLRQKLYRHKDHGSRPAKSPTQRAKPAKASDTLFKRIKIKSRKRDWRGG